MKVMLFVGIVPIEEREQVTMSDGAVHTSIEIEDDSFDTLNIPMLAKATMDVWREKHVKANGT